MRYRLLLLVSGQVLGILIADWAEPQAAFPLWVGTVCAGLFWVARGFGLRPGFWAVGVAISAGAYSLAEPLERASGSGPPLPWDGTLEATVCGPAVATRSGVSMVWCAAHAGAGPGLLPAKAGWVGALGPDLLVRARSQSPEAERLMELDVGQRVRAYARLRPFHDARNPGGFDGLRRAHRKGIGFQAQLLDAALLVRLPERDSPTRFLGSGASWTSGILDLRRRAIQAWLGAERRVSGERADGGALLAALALGDRSGLSARARNAFARLGLAHLLAVSGLHLALIAGFSYRLALMCASRVGGVQRLRDRRPMALGVAVLVSGLYALWTGLGVPVQRAWIFLLLLLLVLWSARRPPFGQALLLAAGGILVFSPESLFELGAQLSFLATAALLLAGGTERLKPDSWGRGAGAMAGVTRGLRTSAVALAATAPLLAYAGLPVGPAGLLLNALAVPWTAFVLLPLALVTSAAVMVLGPESVPGLGWVELLAGWTVRECVQWAEVWPVQWFSGRVSLPVSLVAGALAALACCVASTARAVFLSLCVVLWVLGPPLVARSLDTPRLVMLDVGQGDALLLHGSSAAVLVDGGRAFEEGPDLGRSVVGPALAALGVRRLDVVVATHSDIDHRGGLEHVLRHFEVDELWLPAVRNPGSEFEALRKLADSRGVRTLQLDAGDSERVVGDLRLLPLWPPAQGAPQSSNEGSLVLRAEFGGRRVLLTGDIGEESEKRLLAGGADVRAEILKVAHHGSGGSSTSAFLEAVGAEIALVSAPCSALGGLPSDRALKRLEAAGASVWWTGRDGAVEVGTATDAEGRARLRVWGWGRYRSCEAARRN